MTQEQINKYLRGETTPAERQKILQWINESPGNMAVFRTMRSVYDTMLCGEADLNLSQSVVRGHKPRRSYGRVGTIGGLMLSVCASFMFGAILMSKEVVETVSVVNTIFSPVGQRTELTLADGTHVWLGSNSRLETSSDHNGRNVKLEGEAFFDVAKDAEVPFVVNTSGRSVTVYGTRFNVSAYAEDPDMKVQLYNGRVAVTDSILSCSVDLLPGQEAVAGTAGLTVGDFHPSGDSPLWIYGVYSFQNATYADILTEMSHIYDVDLTMAGNWTDTQRCTCKFYESDGLENMLMSLQHIHPFTYRLDRDSRKLYID